MPTNSRIQTVRSVVRVERAWSARGAAVEATEEVVDAQVNCVAFDVDGVVVVAFGFAESNRPGARRGVPPSVALPRRNP